MSANSDRFDLIIVGGGIYGAMLALEASGSGMEVLLLERNDFGGETTFNNLRTVHGGLRYLQSADLIRFFESVAERNWFLRIFPDLVQPLGCLMPLYGNGIKRIGILRLALFANDVLSIRRNYRLDADRCLPGSRIFNRADTISAFPAVVKEGLQGAGVWYDATMPDSQRILIEVLRWAAKRGAVLRNYVEVIGLIRSRGALQGVKAINHQTGSEVEYLAPKVINATGPSFNDMVTRMGARRADNSQPSLAWNMVVDRPVLSEFALAITPTRPGAPTYFLHPWKGKCLVGTGHSLSSTDAREPSIDQLEAMLDDINSAVPEFNASLDDVTQILAGILPAKLGDKVRLTVRPIVINHAESGGPEGLITICGVKFTTARRVAAQVVRRLTGVTDCRYDDRPPPNVGWNFDNQSALDDDRMSELDHLAREEWVVHLDDLLFRRTTLWEQPELALHWGRRFSDRFYQPDRAAAELQRVSTRLGVGLENSAVRANTTVNVQ